MVLMVFGGVYFLQDHEAVTNEEMQNHVELLVDVRESAEGLYVSAEWDWTVAPAEGLFGDDYLGVSLLDGNGEGRTDVDYEDGELVLFLCRTRNLYEYGVRN